MKILFLTDNFPPEVNAPASRTYEHCVEWAKEGVEVTVITCAPNFPQGRVYEGYRNKLYQEEWMDGIRVIRVWSYITANAGFTRRVLDYVSFALSASLASLFIKTDIIIATSPQFFAAVGGYTASLLKRRPWLMEVRDLWPESIKAVEAMDHQRAIDWLERLELHLYRKARQVIVVTDAFKANISGRGIPANKIQVVKNGVRLSQFRPQPKDAGLTESLGLQGKFVLGYLGTHGLAHKLDFILECASEAPEHVHFLFIGDGAERARLLDIQQGKGLANVSLLPSIPRSEVARYISLTDAALVPLKKSDTFKTVIPSKIFENAAMEKPILLGVEGESQAIIEQYGAGLCFEPENKTDFLSQLQRLSTDSALYSQLQAGCRRLAADFGRERLAREMLEVVRSVSK
ncbi:MAG: glycosyltransferase family 4 protein [Lewinellaceae bacterium]|nr:glycosyltransferase family 4 protein [Lewinellaceae bacterium]